MCVCVCVGVCVYICVGVCVYTPAHTYILSLYEYSVLYQTTIYGYTKYTPYMIAKLSTCIRVYDMCYVCTCIHMRYVYIYIDSLF